MAIRDGKIVREPNEPESSELVSRRYKEVNGGRGPWRIKIDGKKTFEVGPFGHYGVAVQFGSYDPANPFTGTFSANLATSLAPGGRVSRDFEGSPTRMATPGEQTDYDNEIVAAVKGKIYRIDGICSRCRIDVTAFAAGTGGALAAFVM